MDDVTEIQMNKLKENYIADSTLQYRPRSALCVYIIHRNMIKYLDIHSNIFRIDPLALEIQLVKH